MTSAAKNGAISYRPDIDGLRAIAVLSVVIYHLNTAWIPGGFVGVDIFFVISGYLITGIIAKELDGGTFSFSGFYMRRIRRIMPAATAATLATLMLGLVIMLPNDAKSMAESAAASTLSFANIYFWQHLDTDYFAQSSDLVPLLHMWSLGVEEQFYLFWPLFLFACYRKFGRATTIAVAAAVATLSFVHAEAQISSDPKYAYYMLPARSGELLLGGLTYLLIAATGSNFPRALREVMAWAGGLAIAWSLAFIEEGHGFPGVIALIPCLGTTLVIAAATGQSTTVSRLLSNRFLVGIGLISFSLYLWHWPVVAYYRYVFGELQSYGYLVCTGLILTLTLASYRFIEVPFRKPAAGVSRPMALGLATYGVFALAFVAVKQEGVIDLVSPEGYREKLASIEENTKPAYAHRYVCQVGAKPSYLNDQRCVFGAAKPKARALLFGDSNAAHFSGYLKEIASEYGIEVRNIEHASCPPFPGNLSEKYVKPEHIESCRAFNEMVRKDLRAYDFVIIGASWPAYQRNPEFDLDFRSMLDDLAKLNIPTLVALKVPEFKKYDRLCAQKEIRVSQANCVDRSNYEDYGPTPANKKIEALVSSFPNAEIFDIRELICNGKICSPYLNGVPLYFDSGHLSISGSEIIGKLAISQMQVPASLARKIEHGTRLRYTNRQTPLDSAPLRLSDAVAYGGGAEIISAEEGNSIGAKFSGPLASYIFRIPIDGVQVGHVGSVYADLSLELSGWRSISYLAYGIRTKDRRFLHVKNLSPPIGVVFGAQVSSCDSGDVGLGFDAIAHDLSDGASLEIYVKGTPNSSGANMMLLDAKLRLVSCT